MSGSVSVRLTGDPSAMIHVVAGGADYGWHRAGKVLNVRAGDVNKMSDVEIITIPPPTRHRKTIADVPCIHRGEVIGHSYSRSCPSGTRRVDRFSCEVHVECAIGNVLQGKPHPTIDCLMCNDREESKSNVTIPFVWIYWHHESQNDEARWSIRSVVNNFKGNPDVWFVGDRPPWYQGNHIPVQRVGKCHRRSYRDVLNKIKVACESSDIGNQFVWMMDDVYLMQPITWDQLSIPRYHGNHHRKKPNTNKRPNGWEELKRETFVELASRGLPTYDYCVHLPQVIESRKWLEMWHNFGLADRVLQWELIYGNLHYHGRQQHHNGWSRRVRDASQSSEMRASNNYPTIINNPVSGWTESLRAMLWELFPNKSAHEIDKAKPPLWKKLK